MLATVLVQWYARGFYVARIFARQWRTCERGSIAAFSEDSSSSGAVRDLVGKDASDCALWARCSVLLFPSPLSSFSVLSALPGVSVPVR